MGALKRDIVEIEGQITKPRQFGGILQTARFLKRAFPSDLPLNKSLGFLGTEPTFQVVRPMSQSSARQFLLQLYGRIMLLFKYKKGKTKQKKIKIQSC